MSSLFSGHYLRNRSTLDIGVLGYIGIVQHKEHPPEVWSVPPGTPCITRLASNEIFSPSNKIHRELIYINDLPSVIPYTVSNKNSSIVLFADDTSVIISEPC
jgi:hypothetical protein